MVIHGSKKIKSKSNHTLKYTDSGPIVLHAPTEEDYSTDVYVATESS